MVPRPLPTQCAAGCRSAMVGHVRTRGQYACRDVAVTTVDSGQSGLGSGVAVASRVGAAELLCGRRSGCNFRTRRMHVPPGARVRPSCLAVRLHQSAADTNASCAAGEDQFGVRRSRRTCQSRGVGRAHCRHARSRTRLWHRARELRGSFRAGSNISCALRCALPLDHLIDHDVVARLVRATRLSLGVDSVSPLVSQLGSIRLRGVRHGVRGVRHRIENSQSLRRRILS